MKSVKKNKETINNPIKPTGIKTNLEPLRTSSFAGLRSKDVKVYYSPRKVKLINHHDEHTLKSFRVLCSSREKNRGIKVTKKENEFNMTRTNPLKPSNLFPEKPHIKMFQQPYTKRMLDPRYLPDEPPSGIKIIDFNEIHAGNSVEKITPENMVYRPYRQRITSNKVSQITSIPGGLKASNISDDYKNTSKNKVSDIMKKQNDYGSKIDCLNKSVGNIKNYTEEFKRTYSNNNLCSRNNSNNTKSLIQPNTKISFVTSNRDNYGDYYMAISSNNTTNNKNSSNKGFGKASVLPPKPTSKAPYNRKLFTSQIKLV